MERTSGEILDKSVVEEIWQNLPEKQGFLQMTGIQNGLFHSEEWRIMERNDNFMLGENWEQSSAETNLSSLLNT